MEPPKQQERLRFVASSGERRPRRAPSLGTRIAVLTAVLLLALVTVFHVIGPGHRSSPVDAALAAPSPAATASPTERPPTPTATPTALEMASEWITVEPMPTDTPTPLPTATPRPPRRPTPTPTSAQCVSLRWSASQSTATLGQVLVSAELTNHCDRNLQPLEVWVSVAGYRQGALVQTAHGHPFDTITPGHSEDVTIGLPGSLDWYDHLSVEVGDQPKY